MRKIYRCQKTRRTITALIPDYERNRYRWRRRILTSLLRARKKAGVKYAVKGSFEVLVLLYLKKGKRHDINDVDNRLKDILDALQDRFGGSKTIRSKSRLIQNDRQVCRVVIEKQPIQSTGRQCWGKVAGSTIPASQVAVATEQRGPISETFTIRRLALRLGIIVQQCRCNRRSLDAALLPRLPRTNDWQTFLFRSI
jgi:Holliday junction resolvase RusA-like endonuclease